MNFKLRSLPLRAYLLLTLSASLLNLSACQEGNLDGLEQQTSVAAYQLQSIELSVDETYLLSTDIGMPTGKTLPIHLIGIQSGGVTTDITNSVTATWSVNASNGSSINSSGILTAGATPETIQVNASFAGLNATPLSINVYDSANPGLAIWDSQNESAASNGNGGQLDINLCDQKSFSAYYTYPNSPAPYYWPVNDASLTWSEAAVGGTAASSKISSNGVFSTDEALDSALNFTISVSVDGTSPLLSTTRPLVASNIAPSSLRIEPASFTIETGQSKTLAAYATYNSGERLISLAPKWEITAPQTIAMSNNVFTSTTKGSYTVKATCMGTNVSGTAAATVQDNQVRFITIANDSGIIKSDGFIHLNVGDQVTLSITATMLDNTEVANFTDNILWTVLSDGTTDIATVSNNKTDGSFGEVTAVAAGNVTIKATYQGSDPAPTTSVPIVIQ